MDDLVKKDSDESHRILDAKHRVKLLSHFGSGSKEKYDNYYKKYYMDETNLNNLGQFEVAYQVYRNVFNPYA